MILRMGSLRGGYGSFHRAHESRFGGCGYAGNARPVRLLEEPGIDVPPPLRVRFSVLNALKAQNAGDDHRVAVDVRSGGLDHGVDATRHLGVCHDSSLVHYAAIEVDQDKSVIENLVHGLEVA